MTIYTRGKRRGEGRFGIVHEATTKKGAMFAIKTFKDPKIPNVPRDALIKRFKREVKYQATIDHLNVIGVLDKNLDDTDPWFVMELAEKSLGDMMKAGTLSDDLREQALFDILNGLEEVHRKGYAHRDLKPDNILYIDRSGDKCFAISDFGLGHHHDGNSTTLTGAGVTGGTPLYAAPECFKSFGQATPSADIYSFGCILHDFYVGAARTPYARHKGPGAIGKIIERCTHQYPGKRYQRIKDLRADLLAAMQDGATRQYSKEDQTVLDMLERWSTLTDDDLDHIFIRVDELTNSEEFNSEIVISIRESFLKKIAPEHPEYIAALCKHLLQFNIAREGGLDWRFCDVLCDKIIEVFDKADVGGQAELLLALLVLGTKHNRFYVEKAFLKEAKPDAPDELIERMITEADVRDIELRPYLRHLTRSMGVSKSVLHEALAEILDAG